MSVLCHIEDTRVNAGYHGLARRCLGAASEDNQVALVVFDQVYILRTHISYVEVVCKIHSEGVGEFPDLPVDSYRSTLSLNSATPETLLDEQARIASMALLNSWPRIVSATWTPPAIRREGVLTSALCTINVENRIEMWLPKRSHGEVIYEVEKICDLTAAASLETPDVSHIIISSSEDSDSNMSVNSENVESSHPGISLCHFAQVPEDGPTGGFVGILASKERLIALWMSDRCGVNCCDGNCKPPTKVEEEKASRPLVWYSTGGFPPGCRTEFENLVARAIQVNQPLERLNEFDIERIGELFPLPTVETPEHGMKYKSIALIDSGHVSSMDTLLRFASEDLLVYDIYVSSCDGRIRKIEIKIDVDKTGEVTAKLGEWKIVLELPNAIEMLRVRTFHSGDVEIPLLISLVHNSILFYNIATGLYVTHECGSYPLVAYHTEPFFMRGGDIARVVVLDSEGTQINLVITPTLKIRTCPRTIVSTSDFVMLYVCDSEFACLQVAVSHSTLELRRNLRSPHIFATALATLVRGGKLYHFNRLVRHLTYRNELVHTNTMFTRDDDPIHWRIAEMSLDNFVEIAFDSQVTTFWNEMFSLIDTKHPAKARVATLLYFLAYAEAGCDTSNGLIPIELMWDCRPLIQRFLRDLEVTDEVVKQLEDLIDGLYTYKQLTMFKH
ncbi:uncharacterized protein BXIN_0614 [Babesia sp. Xinjiang]|uniref:uncharacterized protein n=1 Tax=Babesia sp. Xinjiang TaxID=462227 RepID=UPI000A248991|nr:uncharacterized protein BXIN_0614 [Babesia sp. Xinjiang]ORM41794.1 hypothetical protein BXIN_0614 [Babesia sp. Xinjiang]